MAPIIADQPDRHHRSGEVVSLFVPSHEECWRRIRLAQSLLSHRLPGPETTRTVIRVLDGWWPDGSVPG